jgi:pre-mRNA-splicing factor ATP-dependent RNA helicase DHX16
MVIRIRETERIDITPKVEAFAAKLLGWLPKKEATKEGGCRVRCRRTRTEQRRPGLKRPELRTSSIRCSSPRTTRSRT